ncbi:MAG: type II secretion system protein [Phycisphaerales bacterium]
MKVQAINPEGQTRRCAKRGFTLVEILIMITLIVVLSALLLFAIGPAVKSARTASDHAFARSMGVGVEQFRQQFGFLPPLVDDFASGGPIEEPASPALPFIRLKTGDTILPRNDAVNQARFLRHEDTPPDGANQTTLRMSYFSLPFYLLGTAGESNTDTMMNAKVDGVQGPGFTQPLADGTFTRSGTRHEPMMSLAGLTERLQLLGGTNERTFGDRQRRGVRYYRWAPTLHVAAGTPVPPLVVPAPANDPLLAGQVRSYNAPTVFPLGVRQRLISGQLEPVAAVMSPQQRSARYAIVFPGLDGLFGDETIATLRTQLGLIASTQIDDDEVRRRAALDNLVILEGGS